jgi:predicted small metal-binding protein
MFGIMTVQTTCKGCGAELTAEDEDKLVSLVQEHLAEAHPGGHSPSREQILAVLRTRGRSRS